MKRNRDAIAKMAIYDLLCRMNIAILSHQDEVFAVEPFETDVGYSCIIDTITGQKANCPDVKEDMTGYDNACEFCVAKWLNESYDGRW